MEVIICNIENIQWNTVFPLAKHLSVERQKKISRYKFELDKIQSLISALIVRKNVWEGLHIPNENQEYSVYEHGKPYLKNKTDYFFSVSHSKNLVAFAQNNNPIGVDTELNLCSEEKINRVKNKYFSKTENNFIEESSDKVRAFFRIWTAKESYVKMLGTGLTKPLNSFDVLNPELEKYFISFTFNNYTITLCSKNIEKEKIKITETDINELMKFYK